VAVGGSAIEARTSVKGVAGTRMTPRVGRSRSKVTNSSRVTNYLVLLSGNPHLRYLPTSLLKCQTTSATDHEELAAVTSCSADQRSGRRNPSGS
jgi:hypothetical protein